MKVWECEVFVNEALTLPCVRFVGRFSCVESATKALHAELSAVQLVLYPGALRETIDDGSFTAAAPFRMVRF